MDNFFVPSNAVSGANASLTTPLGAALVCVVLLVLFYLLFIKGKFVAVDPKAGFGAQTGFGLRWQDNDQLNVGAGFQAGYEPPVFWGSSGEKELYNNQRMTVSDTNNLLEEVPVHKRSGAAGFKGRNDAELLAAAQGYGN